MQDSIKISNAKRRADLRWVLAFILLLSIGLIAMDYCDYRFASMMLYNIRRPPHPAALKNQEEQAVGDFEAVQEKVQWRMAPHSGLVLLALYGLWRVPRKEGQQ